MFSQYFTPTKSMPQAADEVEGILYSYIRTGTGPQNLTSVDI